MPDPRDPAPSPVFLQPVGLQGIVTLYCIRPDGTERPGSRITLNNRIVNAGLDYLCSTADVQGVNAFNFCGVGDSSTAVSDAQTSLQNPIMLDGVNARTSTTFTNDAATAVGGTAPDYYASMRKVRKFAAATANRIVRELGFFTAASGGTMLNRLVVSPDYSVLTGEELVVDLEVRFYVPNADVSGTVTISGVSYGYTIRAQQAQSTNPWANQTTLCRWSVTQANCSTTAGLVAQTANKVGTDSVSATPAAYVSGTYYRDVEYVWDPATFTASVSFVAWWGNRMQCAFSTPIPKDGTKRLKLTFRHQFTRLT